MLHTPLFHFRWEVTGVQHRRPASVSFGTGGSRCFQYGIELLKFFHGHLSQPIDMAGVDLTH